LNLISKIKMRKNKLLDIFEKGEAVV